ncbi:ArgS-related anticodon-binding protein NrtL [Streptomyces sp. NPDC087420]|uniref:ArgS-related anticodon-binding protein NrtL n=1 Tax=Streptomyces sp. NPDC087420 TaxID=3365785 RepID=UPI00383568AE
MTPADLSTTVLRAVRRAVADGALSVAVPERVTVERPRPGGSGDYATNAALRLAAGAGLAPREVAEILRARVAPADGIARVEITGPGFLNFTLAEDDGADLVRTVLSAGPHYGHGNALTGTTAVFVNPHGPRARVWTETVVAVLRSQGATASIAPAVPGGRDAAVAPRGARPDVSVTNPTAASAAPPPVPETLRVVPAPDGDDLFARLGADAARWALLRTAAHDRPPSGSVAGELLVQRESNPLFRVRYAYARTRALTRAAERLGITRGTPENAAQAPHPTEATLTRLLRDHPAVLEAAARHRAPDRLARGLEQVAEAVLRFQESGRPLPLGDEKPSAAHRSRIALAEAAGAVLAGGLLLLGVDAPEFL